MGDTVLWSGAFCSARQGFGPLGSASGPLESNPRVHTCRFLVHLRPNRPSDGRYALHEALRAPDCSACLPEIKSTLGFAVPADTGTRGIPERFWLIPERVVLVLE